MDRKSQLKNVSFGGAWSEQIAGNEQISAALEEIQKAIGRTEDEDLRLDVELSSTLLFLSRKHPKGAELQRAWAKALTLPSGYDRGRELDRIVRVYRSWLG